MTTITKDEIRAIFQQILEDLEQYQGPIYYRGSAGSAPGGQSKSYDLSVMTWKDRKTVGIAEGTANYEDIVRHETEKAVKQFKDAIIAATDVVKTMDYNLASIYKGIVEAQMRQAQDVPSPLPVAEVKTRLKTLERRIFMRHEVQDFKAEVELQYSRKFENAAPNYPQAFYIMEYEGWKYSQIPMILDYLDRDYENYYEQHVDKTK